jgi:hypothetical protein
MIAGSCCGMERCKRKNILIEDDIARNINVSCRNLKALETFMHITIAKENTAGRPKL